MHWLTSIKINKKTPKKEQGHSGDQKASRFNGTMQRELSPTCSKAWSRNLDKAVQMRIHGVVAKKQAGRPEGITYWLTMGSHMGREINEVIGQMNWVRGDQGTYVHKAGTGPVQHWHEWERGRKARVTVQRLPWVEVLEIEQLSAKRFAVRSRRWVLTEKKMRMKVIGTEKPEAWAMYFNLYFMLFYNLHVHPMA